MPNYSLIVNSKFQPFSFDEYIKPYQIYGQAYKEQEEALVEMISKAEDISGKLNPELDKETYTKYNNYITAVNKQAEELANNGLSPSSRKEILGLKSLYSKDVSPIIEAYNRRAEQIKEQRNSNKIFDYNAAMTSLDAYLANPALSYRSIDGEEIKQAVMQEASALSKELQEDPTPLKKIVGGDYYTYIKQRGFKSSDILKAITETEGASPILKDIIDRAVSSSGVNSWNNIEATERVKDYAKQGLWAAVGQSDSQLTDNWRARMDAEQKNWDNRETTRNKNAIAEIEARSAATLSEINARNTGKSAGTNRTVNFGEPVTINNKTGQATYHSPNTEYAPTGTKVTIDYTIDNGGSFVIKMGNTVIGKWTKGGDFTLDSRLDEDTKKLLGAKNVTDEEAKEILKSFIAHVENITDQAGMQGLKENNYYIDFSRRGDSSIIPLKRYISNAGNVDEYDSSETLLDNI